MKAARAGGRLVQPKAFRLKNTPAFKVHKKHDAKGNEAIFAKCAVTIIQTPQIIEIKGDLNR